MKKYGMLGLLLICAMLFIPQKAMAKDDYPAEYKNARQDAVIDRYSFLNRECTSFCAWCLNSRNKVKFTNIYKGKKWGNAKNWGNVAKQLKIKVDMNPAVGSIYWSTTGYWGHVAWVSAVNGDNVTIEEYNGRGDGTYGTRTIKRTSASGYIHIKDVLKSGKEVPSYGKLLPDGDYHIVSGLSSKLGLDVAGNRNKNGTNIQIYKNTTTPEQVFTVKYNANGFYTIKQKSTGKVIDVEGNSKICGTNVNLYKKNKTKAQDWNITADKDNRYYNIIARNSGYALDVSGGVAKNKTNVQIWERNNTNSQKWQFIPVAKNEIPDGTYIIRTKINTNRCLNVVNDANVPGTNVDISTRVNNNKQVFYVKNMKDGSCRISYYRPLEGKLLCLTAKVDKKTSSINVQLEEDKGDANQRWYIKKEAKGKYGIISKATNLYLDVAGAIDQDHTNVQPWIGNNLNAQKWQFDVYKSLSTEAQKIVSKLLDSTLRFLKKKITIRWQKINGANGYEIQWSTDKKFKNCSKCSLSANVTSYTINKTENKKYYVRFRAFATYKDDENKIAKKYTKWFKFNG